nr:exocyst complex component sec5 [Quercus suber]
MPISADQERQLLNRYKLTNLFPSEWPHQVDDGSDDEEADDDLANALPARHPSKSATNNRSSQSRIRNINRHASLRSSISSTQRHQGVDSLVQKDEPDPLGMAPSVASELRRRGLPVEENINLRNRFMLSSTSFSPALFLSQVHQDASTEDLLRGLDFLTKSIEQKSASLKILVESNFEKFVRAKATIDNVYTEMRAQGADSDASPTTAPPTGRRPHSRHTSRTQSHFRNTSGAFSPTKAATSDKKKNALTKESEYGVQGIKVPLQDLSIKAEEVWGPALGGREKEETLKTVLLALDQHRLIFRLSGEMYESVRKSDYEGVLDAHKKAKKYAAEARSIADIARSNNVQLGDSDAQQIIVTAKMWHDVSEQVEAFKHEVLKRLENSHGRKAAAVADEADKDIHMELIGVLLQLGVDENPIWQWLNSRYLYLKEKIVHSFERSRVEIEILRRRLSSQERTDSKALAAYLQSGTASLRSNTDKTSDFDTPAIIAFWDRLHSSLLALISSRSGVLGEVLEFWDTAQSFIDNKAQKSFPTAVFAAGLEHLELEPDDVASLRSGCVDLINLLRDNVMALFSDVPPEDLSELYSPIPPTPTTASSAGGSGTPSLKRSFSFDPNNIPPLSPSTGAAWEKYAFWPPNSNSLSGSHYLSLIISLVGTAAAELASLSVMKQSSASQFQSRPSGIENLKALINTVRERCTQAVCSAWALDAERCRFLETWTRSADRKDLTSMPTSFMAFEEKILGAMQKITYVSEATVGRSGDEASVVMPPPAKLLQAVRSSFVTSLYKALSGMVENAEKNKRDVDTETVDPDGVMIPAKANNGIADGTGIEGVDASNRNVRLLLTLSNIAYLRADIIPHLISQYESSFSVKLTEESKTIRDVLGQIDARLFQSYVRPTVDQLTSTITSSITSPSWIPQAARPDDAKSYVYDVLLALVLVHSEVSTTAANLTNQILSYLLEQASLALINAFKQRNYYTLPALMQATLDVEFMTQTLKNYTTDKAEEVQRQIYLALDERTNDDARKKLQSELQDLSAVLKKLREGTKGEFGCFRRERKARGREGKEGSR